MDDVNPVHATRVAQIINRSEHLYLRIEIVECVG